MSRARFTFRAQAALDLRTREHDAARRTRARAEADLRAANRASAEAGERAAGARARCAALMQESGSVAQQHWYRSWILKLDRERALAESVVTASDAELARATAAEARAHQRVKSLERFRDKARASWERDALAAEQKVIDGLAAMRYVASRREQGRNA